MAQCDAAYDATVLTPTSCAATNAQRWKDSPDGPTCETGWSRLWPHTSALHSGPQRPASPTPASATIDTGRTRARERPKCRRFRQLRRNCECKYLAGKRGGDEKV